MPLKRSPGCYNLNLIPDDVDFMTTVDVELIPSYTTNDHQDGAIQCCSLESMYKLQQTVLSRLCVTSDDSHHALAWRSGSPTHDALDGHAVRMSVVRDDDLSKRTCDGPMAAVYEMIGRQGRLRVELVEQ